MDKQKEQFFQNQLLNKAADEGAKVLQWNYEKCKKALSSQQVTAIVNTIIKLANESRKQHPEESTDQLRKKIIAMNRQIKEFVIDNGYFKVFEIATSGDEEKINMLKKMINLKNDIELGSISQKKADMDVVQKIVQSSLKE